MDEEQYLSDRLNDQIRWYDSKSQWNKKYYNIFRIIELFLGASIPFLVGFIRSADSMIKPLVGACGVVIALLTGLHALFRFQENALQYRTTCEALKHEKYRYATKAAPYDRGDAFQYLVQNVEAQISKENSSWAQVIRRRDDTTKAHSNKPDAGDG